MLEIAQTPHVRRARRQMPLVVCVDDEPRVLASLRRLLSEEPYEMIVTHEPRKVLKLIGSRTVSLVIADQRMPEISMPNWPVNIAFL